MEAKKTLKGKLVRALSTFNERELRELRWAIDSPLFNERKKGNAIRLFDYLTTKSTQRNKGRMEKGKVFNAVYPEKDFNKDLLDEIQTVLWQIVARYLAFVQLRSDEFKTGVNLCLELQSRGLEDLFNIESNALLKRKGQAKNTDHLFYRSKILKEQFLVASGESEVQRLGQYVSESFQHTLCVVLEQAAYAEIFERLGKKTIDLPSVDGFVSFIGEQLENLHPLVQLWFYLYQMTKSPEETSFADKASILLEATKEQISKIEQKKAFYFIKNHYIRLLNSTPEYEFKKKMFEIYKAEVEAGHLFENQKLNAREYLNIAKSALILGKFQESEYLLERCKPLLDKNEQESFFNYGMFLRYVFEKKYNKALEHHEKIPHIKDEILFPELKRYLIKAYYEIGDDDRLDSESENLRVFLQRDKRIPYHKENYKNYLSFIGKIRKVKSRKAKINLQSEIANAKSLPDQAWLLEILEKVQVW